MSRVRSPKIGTRARQASDEKAKAPRAPAGTGPSAGGEDGFEERRPERYRIDDEGEAGAGPASDKPVHDPTLIPRVPPGATSDPGLQYRELLGPALSHARARVEALPRPSPEAILSTLPPDRAQAMQRLLAGPATPTRAALESLLASEGFLRSSSDERRRALEAFDLSGRSR